MSDQFVVIKRAGLSGVDKHADQAAAEAAASLAVLKDGEPRLVIQVHHVIARKVSAEVLPPDAEVVAQ